ncbi:hypothetical protein CDL15_Pgr009154 [Punica granatum]|nr:hypothetical protein CDL15_Pgr009154 [Punica granatum]
MQPSSSSIQRLQQHAPSKKHAMQEQQDTIRDNNRTRHLPRATSTNEDRGILVQHLHWGNLGCSLLRNNYVPGTGLGAHGQGNGRPIEVEDYKNRRGLGFCPSCHEIVEARMGNYLHCLLHTMGGSTGASRLPRFPIFSPDPHASSGTPLAALPRISTMRLTLCQLCTLSPRRLLHIRLARENEELDNWTLVPRYLVVIADV